MGIKMILTFPTRPPGRPPLPPLKKTVPTIVHHHHHQRRGLDAHVGWRTGRVDQSEAGGGDERRVRPVPDVASPSLGPRAAQGGGKGHALFGEPEQARERDAEEGERFLLLLAFLALSYVRRILFFYSGRPSGEKAVVTGGVSVSFPPHPPWYTLSFALTLR